jgi:hypothetical protein
MINQHAIFQRRKQRRQTHQADHLTIPLEQELSQNVYNTASGAFQAASVSLAQMIRVVRSNEINEITPAHCSTMEAAFPTMLQALKVCITALNGPDLAADMRPYTIIVRLSTLYRTVIGAQRLVKNVYGQCRSGHPESDPTGSYWHLRTCLRDIVRDYQRLASQLPQEQDISAIA